MRGTRRSVASILSLVLVLAACGGDEGNEEPEETPPAGETDDAGADDNGAEEEPAAADLDCGTYSLVVLDDDSHRMLTAGLVDGTVTSEAIPEVEVDYVQIPALVAATGTDQYTVTQTSLPGVVFASAAGAEVKIIATALAHTGGGMKVFTPADSGIDSAEDLPGLTVGISSFGSTAAIQTQIALAEAHGIDAAFEGGDLDWVELDPPTLLNAVKTGQVDAAVMWHTAGWMALNDDELQVAVDVDNDYEGVTGEWPVGSAMVVTAETAESEPECVSEFQRMLEESEAYARDNASELAQTIAEESGQPVEFIEYWWTSGAYEMGATLEEPWTARADAFFEAAARNELLPPASMEEFAFQG